MSLSYELARTRPRADNESLEPIIPQCALTHYDKLIIITPTNRSGLSDWLDLVVGRG